MAINAGDSKTVDGVIYTAVDSTNLKAVSTADTDHDTSVDVKVEPSGQLFEPSRRLKAGTWEDMSAKLKEEILDEADRKRAGTLSLRQTYDGFPSPPGDPSSKLLGDNIKLRLTAEGHVTARSVNDPSDSYVVNLNYKPGQLEIVKPDQNPAATVPRENSWENTERYLNRLFEGKDGERAAKKKIETDWAALQ